MDTTPGMAATAALDPSRYPRTYRYDLASRCVLGTMGVAFVALSAFMARGSRPDQLVATVLIVGMTGGLGLWLVAAAWRTRAILSERGIDYRGAVLARSVPLADIAGWRRTPGQQRGIQFDLKPGAGRRLRITSDLKRDADWDAWFARLPDLDAAERAASRAQVLGDTTLGATPQDVAPKLDRVIAFSRVAMWLAAATAVSLQFEPWLWDRHVILATALCIPLLALLAALLLPGLVTLSANRNINDVRPSMLGVMLLPSMALGAYLWNHANLARCQPLVAPALACGLLGLLLAVRRDPTLRQRAGDALLAFACIGVYGGVATAWIDIAADVRAAPGQRVAVVGTYTDKGPVWRVRLGPAPTPTDWATIDVPRHRFFELQVGDVACLREHPGLLGMPWAELQACADAAGRTPEQAAHHWLAHVARPASQRPPLAQALVDGDWRRVDATLNDLQKRFEAGDATEVDVEQAFIPLYNVEPALDAPLADWLARAPGSYAARVAMALHTERQIEWLSGAGFDARRSPAFNWEERTAFALAQVDAAMALSRRPALALMSKYRLTPRSWQQVDDWTRRMVAIDPEDVSMRREMLVRHPVCPCHGQAPADPAMAALLGGHPSQRVRDTLSALRLLQRGVDAGETPQAIALYRQALALHPYPQDAYEAHIAIGSALGTARRLDEAVDELKAAIATLPGNRHAHEVLGWVYEQQGRKPEALAEFLVDAERGQSWAQMRAGSFLLTPEPGVTEDRRAGASWMREAANQGEKRAREILRSHPDLMLAYPPTW